VRSIRVLHGLVVRVLLVLAASGVVTALALGACRDGGRDRVTPEQIAPRGSGSSSGSESRAGSPAIDDPLVEQFRAVERGAIARYSAALAEQRANHIDELELAQIIEHEVLTPWREIRTRVTAATVPAGGEALYRTLLRYLEARQISWEAYTSALRAADDEAARRHLDVHRQKNAEAQVEARELGRLFREATGGGDPRSP
jgi:hypothetical protein